MSTWYYEDKGEPRGPISEIHLQSMLANGIIPVGTLVWQESFGKHWKPANETSLIPPKPTAAVPPPIVPTVAAQAVTAPTTVQPLSDVMTRWIALSPLWIMAFNVGMALLGFDFERPPASSWPFLASVALFILAERDASRVWATGLNSQRRSLVPFMFLTPLGYLWRRSVITGSSMKWVWVWLSCVAAFVIIGTIAIASVHTP